MKYTELEGLTITCCKGSNAIIQLSNGKTLTTSKVVEVKGLWSGFFFFETENTYYRIAGTVLTKDDNNSIQDTYNKIITILNQNNTTLDTTSRPLLKKGNEIKYFSDMENWYKAFDFGI